MHTWPVTAKFSSYLFTGYFRVIHPLPKLALRTLKLPDASSSFLNPHEEVPQNPPAARPPAPRRPVCPTPACTTPAACPTRARHVRPIAASPPGDSAPLPLKAPQLAHDLSASSSPSCSAETQLTLSSCHPARSEPLLSATAAPYQHRRSTSHLSTTWASPHTWARGLGLKPERCQRSPD